MSKKANPLAVLALLPFLAVACGESNKTTETTAPAPKPQAPAPVQPAVTPMDAAPAAPAAMGAPSATAELMALGGSGVSGKVTFTEKDGKVWVEAKLSGLAPGEHGFHVHEFGDCSAPDGTSAGGHFNPGTSAHGPFNPASPHHAGDLGNVTADASGNATLSANTDQFSLGMDAKSILGRGLIVHEKADDFKTQPTGNAGGRIACAVIKADTGTTTPVLKPATP